MTGSATPVDLPLVYVPVGGRVTIVNSWCDLVEVECEEVELTEEMHCDGCAMKPFLQDDYTCTFLCTNSARIDGKSVRFRKLQE